ncbi:MAG: efflux RND transporter periplasmic adaptor subunit [Methylophilaceae bacterium]|nr:efflux RND transporter periplasmic adaptor subunit [Methylophilaceae bacterium]
MRFNFKQALTMVQSKRWLVLSLITLTVTFIALAIQAKTSESTKSTQLPKQHIVDEGDLNTVSLTDDSVNKLGIQIAPVLIKTISENKIYGGETVVPTGGKVSITAPVSGKLIALGKSKLVPGEKISAGQLLYRIQPIITADARANMIGSLADADSLVNTAKSQVEATNIAFVRAKKLLQDLVGSQRNVDEGRAAYEIALRNLEAAKAKKKAINAVANVGAIQAIDIKSPQAGILSNIFAVPNQLVSAGSPIVEVSETNSLWVRIPVPLGDLDSIDLQADITISALSAHSTTTASLIGKPVNAPPTADPLSGSAHLYYAIQNKATQNNISSLRPAQRVSVALKMLSKKANHLTVPWSAIVIDIYGGNWVYVQKNDQTFVRNRVFVDYVSGDTAVMSDGLTAGEKVVTNGALELFGVETGFTH